MFLRQQNRDLQSKVTELADQLLTEQEAHKRSQTAMNQLKDGLKSEMDKYQSQQAAGEDVKVAFHCSPDCPVLIKIVRIEIDRAAPAVNISRAGERARGASGGKGCPPDHGIPVEHRTQGRRLCFAYASTLEDSLSHV